MEEFTGVTAQLEEPDGIPAPITGARLCLQAAPPPPPLPPFPRAGALEA